MQNRYDFKVEINKYCAYTKREKKLAGKLKNIEDLILHESTYAWVGVAST